MRIEVTQSDIDAATPGARTCPIAQAFRRILPEATFAIVGPMTLQIQSFGHNRGPLVMLPPEARDFVALWDGAYTVQPFTFEIEDL